MEWKRNTYVLNVTFTTLRTNDILNQYRDFMYMVCLKSKCTDFPVYELVA